jgi:hypothetical protein
MQIKEGATSKINALHKAKTTRLPCNKMRRKDSSETLRCRIYDRKKRELSDTQGGDAHVILTLFQSFARGGSHKRVSKKRVRMRFQKT